MSEENPEVMQGRLGWESGDISEALPGELEPHPKNREIYGDTDSADDLDETFLESVEEKGVLEPLVITNGKHIISGHRRWLAAKRAGKDKVPVRYSEFDNEYAEREALIEFNRQREKTPGQIVNEFEEVLDIEKQRANERKGHGETAPGKPKDNAVGNNSQSEQPDRARNKAAEKVNAEVSGRTLEKGLEVKEKAEQGDETAQKAWEGLESGDESFSSAYDSVKDAESENETEENDISQFTSQQSDEWSSPRELVEPLDNAIGGYDLDPASGAENSPFAKQTYTEADDGLAQEWHGKVWLNPPYSEMRKWTNKVVQEADKDNVETITYLCKGDSSTDWWQNAVESAELVTAIDHRLSFGDGDNSAPFASHVMVFGTVTSELVRELENHGTVLTPGWEDD